MARVFLLRVVLVLCLAAGKAFAGDPDQVLVIMSAQDGAHAELAAALRTKLNAALPTARIVEQDASAVTMQTLAGNRVIVTVGSEAARITANLAPAQTVVHTLIPAATYRDLPVPPAAGAKVAVIVLDQPASRQIALLRIAFPDWQRIALLAGDSADISVRQLADAARAQHFEVREGLVGAERELYPALQKVLAEPAILIATPEPQIFSSATIQNVLLTAYRRRSPVLGFSAAYTRAGALLSLYSTPAQIGEQASALVVRALRGSALPAVQGPSQFELAINANVARSLGIEMESADKLRAALIRLEGGKP